MIIASWQESCDKARQYVKKQIYHFVDKGLYNQTYGLSSSHVQMQELDNNSVLKNRCFWTVVLENTIESPLENKEIKLVNLKGNQPWIFIGRMDAEAEAPVLQPSDAKIQLIEKDPDAGKDWRQKEKTKTEDEMVGWHHWCNGHELGQTPGDGENREAWHATVHGVTRSQTQLANWTTIWRK